MAAALPPVEAARALYDSTFGPPTNADAPLGAGVAPGRVNLIGEHTDYTGGFVLPMAIGYHTACVGRGGLVPDSSGGGGGGRCRVVSSNQRDGSSVVEFVARPGMDRLDSPSWANYVAGVVAQYVPDVPPGMSLAFDAAISGNVPLGSGLSSSASLEVAVAAFLESILGDRAHSSSDAVSAASDKGRAAAISRALRCRRAENEWCDSPCGIMDQFISSAAGAGGKALLIDCEAVDFEEVSMGGGGGGGGGDGDGDGDGDGGDAPVVVVCNSNVTHSIGGGEYPVRVAQCKDAARALSVGQLRDATPGMVEGARASMDDVTYRRARHVTTENERTREAGEAMRAGNWEKMGVLMNWSHTSMRDDYEVSCPEIDALVAIAVSSPGVYGSRLTGGGFGGCTVTLVKRDEAEELMRRLRDGYREQFDGKECDCFVTGPGPGARAVEL